jgi:predicted nucleic acid-binding protein
MKILIDTNIASDVLLQRQPFYSDAIKIFALSKGGIELFISASAITDIYYITSREKKSRDIAINFIGTTSLKHLRRFRYRC